MSFITVSFHCVVHLINFHSYETMALVGVSTIPLTELQLHDKRINKFINYKNCHRAFKYPLTQTNKNDKVAHKPL